MRSLERKLKVAFIVSAVALSLYWFGICPFCRFLLGNGPLCRLLTFHRETGDLHGSVHRNCIFHYEKPINIQSENMDKSFIGWHDLALVAVKIPGIGAFRNGSQSWIVFGPLSLQPAEFIKVALIGKLASSYAGEIKRERCI